MLEASQLGLINVCKFFEDDGVPLDYIEEEMKEGILHYAVKGGQEKTVHYYLQKGLDPNVQNIFRESPIFFAIDIGSMQIVYTLFRDSRLRPDFSDKFGDTIMHYAARHGHLEILEFILERYKKLMTRENQAGKTPLRLANENGRITCAALLREYEAPIKYGAHLAMMKNMAESLVKQAPNYKASLISTQQGERINKALVQPQMMSREDIIAEREYKIALRHEEEEKKLEEEKTGIVKKEPEKAALAPTKPVIPPKPKSGRSSKASLSVSSRGSRKQNQNRN